MVIPILLGLAVVVGIILLFVGIMQTLEQSSEFEQRLDTVMGRQRPADTKALEAGGQGGATTGQAVAAAVEKALIKRGYGTNVQESLSRADLKFTVGEYMVLRFVTALLGAGLGYIAGLTNSLIQGVPLPFAVAGLFIGYMAPRYWVGNRASGRLAAFNSQLPETVNLLSNALRSGNSIAQAMALASREAPYPTNGEFARVVAEMSLGVPPEQALSNLMRRVPSGDLDLMITAVNVSAEVGGNLAEVLEKIGETIRQRIRLKGDIETLTAQQQGAGYIVSILPLLIGIVLFLLNGKYMKPMFSGFPYLCLPICAGLMIFIGFLAMKKITDIKV
ncbi:MAG: type II secretion system F family protein [Chloroflexi bacterium]|nr:type II secretion system F family protein [Chloroflexota bacterium]